MVAADYILRRLGRHANICRFEELDCNQHLAGGIAGEIAGSLIKQHMLKKGPKQSKS